MTRRQCLSPHFVAALHFLFHCRLFAVVVASDVFARSISMKRSCVVLAIRCFHISLMSSPACSILCLFTAVFSMTDFITLEFMHERRHDLTLSSLMFTRNILDQAFSVERGLVNYSTPPPHPIIRTSCRRQDESRTSLGREVFQSRRSAVPDQQTSWECGTPQKRRERDFASCHHPL